MYHQTTRITDAEFARAAATAKAQEDRLLLLFRKYGALSPSMALRAWVAQGWREVPLTSIRRGITDLCKAGALDKTEVQVRGMYGHVEGVWSIAQPAQAAA